ncbi:AAA family ATPase, partial [bacterium]|nr:AAA family ATPase [bacterium]
MDAFVQGRTHWFVGRKKELDALKDFVDRDLADDESRLGVVKSLPGQGKSALLAEFTKRLNDAKHCFVISHFVGASENSNNVEKILGRLTQELDNLDAPITARFSDANQYSDLRLRFSDMLRDYIGRRIVLIIDGINQINDRHDLNWLPETLGAGVRIIVSCIDDPDAPTDSPEAHVMKALRERGPQPFWLDLKPLNESDVRSVVEKYFEEFGKIMEEESLRFICSMRQVRNPLYLLVILQELQMRAKDMMVLYKEDLIKFLNETEQNFPNTLRLFIGVIDRLEADANFGKEKVQSWCCLLSAGRNGIPERILNDLFEKKFTISDPIRYARRIQRALRPYLQFRGPYLDFFHDQLRAA